MKKISIILLIKLLIAKIRNIEIYVYIIVKNSKRISSLTFSKHSQNLKISIKIVRENFILF